MTITDPDSTNSLGEVEAEPQQTDNGPKEGDADVDQESVELPSAGEHEGAGLAATVLATAMKHRGTIEAPPGSNRTPFGADYGWNGVAWCKIFVSRMGFEVAGDYDLLGKFAGTIACAQWWQKQGRFGAEPRPGATVFFDWKGGRNIGAIDHIGLVIEDLGNGRVRTIEGNAAIKGRTDGVWVHDRSTAFIVGYGYPSYAGSVAKAAVKTAAQPVALAAKGVAVPAFPGPDGEGKDRRRGARPTAAAQGAGLEDHGRRGVRTKTDHIVRAFQKDKGLTVDGEVVRARGAPCGPRLSPEPPGRARETSSGRVAQRGMAAPLLGLGFLGVIAAGIALLSIGERSSADGSGEFVTTVTWVAWKFVASLSIAMFGLLFVQGVRLLRNPTQWGLPATSPRTRAYVVVAAVSASLLAIVQWKFGEAVPVPVAEMGWRSRAVLYAGLLGSVPVAHHRVARLRHVQGLGPGRGRSDRGPRTRAGAGPPPGSTG